MTDGQERAVPPEAWEPLLRWGRLLRRPLERFLRIEAASGIVLLVAAAIALLWANSPWADSYFALWHTPLAVRVGAFSFERSLEWLINDALMVIFFFVVGLEIRRELHHGELSEWRRAALPAAAAVGGMIAPASVYLALAGQPELRSGWGVPMATDIAFAVGVLALLGKRVPPALRVLLLALAVIDDLGAIVVIALFYSAGIAFSGLLVAALGLCAVFVLQRASVRSKAVYVLPAFVVWAGIDAAGVHPTIAGVIVGLVTPVRTWLGPAGLAAGIKDEIDNLTAHPLGAHELAASLRHVDLVRREAMSPAESLIEALHPWVAFLIMPVFALANAGVALPGGTLDAASWQVVAGVALGLIVGKPCGVLLAIWLTLRLGIGVLPRGIGVRHLLVLGVVGGIGFTMALFVAQLAFVDPGLPPLLAAAKIGVLAASAAAAVIGLTLGFILLKSWPGAGAARSADEAESSTEL